MDINVPGAAAVQQRATLEEDLANVFAALLEDRASSHDAVWETYDICRKRVEALRAEAAEQLHRPSRHIVLKALAEEMEAQAATWQLLFCLYCDPAPPAGSGGIIVPDVGGASLYRQRVADVVGKDAELARCARVVAWLESLAEDALNRQGMVAFAAGEGLWHETKTEMRTRPDAMLSELDPDAPGRTGRPLHPSNARSQERFLARVWQLMRAGNLPEAQDLCRQVGQPWRAAAIGGGGPVGALPVGIAALEYDEGDRTDLQVEELADEVANGSGSLLALWRWAAQQAAAAPPGDKFERAVLGALGGATAAAAPACSSWEDFAWVYCRSWLESQAMREVRPEAQSVGDLVAGDAVTAALMRCGVAPAAAQRSVEGAMSVAMGGGAAAATMYDTGGDASSSSSSRGFGQLFVQHVMSPAALVGSGPAAVQALRLVQGLLVQGDMHELVAHLFTTLAELRAAGGDAEVGTAAADDFGGGGGGGAVAAVTAAFSATNPERRRRTCALAAHMLLALEGLGVLRRNILDPASTGPDALEAHSVVDLTERLLVFFTGLLLEQEQLALVPMYLCVMRPPERSSLCGELLALHTRRLTGVGAVSRDGSAADAEGLRSALAEADAQCHAAVVALDYWFRRCAERQRKPDAERLSLLTTDIRKDELRFQLATFTFARRHDRVYGPHQRARVARWLALPHIIAVEAAASASAGGAAAAAADADGAIDADGAAAAAAAAEDAIYAAAARLDPRSYYDVLEFSNCLCCEFALGDDVTAAAGQRLFEEVLPEALEAAACASADLLEASAAVATASAAAAAAAGDAATGDADGGPVYMFEQDREMATEQPPSEREARRSSEAALALAAQLRDRAAELAGWRLFYALDAKLAAWTARHEAHEQARERVHGQAGLAGAEEEEALLQDGGALLQEYLHELLQAGWQQHLATPERALVAAAADGHIRVALTVTCPPAGSGTAFLGLPTGDWGQPTAPYPELQGAALLEFKQALESGLRRAAAERGVAVEVGVEVAAEGGAAEMQPQGRGHVTLSLAVAADAQLWRGLVGLVCGVVVGELEGVPPLLLVGMEADRATSLAVCRRCCIGQAVMRCAALRLSLVRLGADAECPAAGPQLVEMLAAPVSEAASGLGPLESGLLELLSASQLEGVLRLEADTYEQHLRNMQELRRQQQMQMLR
ncbi:hypothetical protein PLESTB_000501400 [Pleodorina starrii]|uniref:Nuclear pore complex protein n=1 Tax=Pleodorina starrii TaxID=330485 RepID=A0A9W6BGN1_9CHLO|nr:hypothetical protein PLESTM_001775200 [Pleodorina starrii]GLC51428.1 hypothetical protein PLESTB_000501400 [Pleodorina starrii]GLC67755.1 hypothetical protein PLESTF_000602100 [Pleodorina starrii]